MTLTTDGQNSEYRRNAGSIYDNTDRGATAGWGAPRVTYELTCRGNLSAEADKNAEIQTLAKLLRKTMTATL